MNASEVVSVADAVGDVDVGALQILSGLVGGVSQDIQGLAADVSAATLFLVFTSLIGVCASTEMRCQITKVWGIDAAAVVFATSLINLLSGKEGQVPG